MTPAADRVVRVGLVVVGISAVAYGALLLLDNPWPVLVRIGVWAAAGVLVHDFVFAPCCAALGLLGRRLLPTTWWKPLAVAALCTAVIVLLAVPVYDRPGARPDNPTLLDRDYQQATWLLIGFVWGAAAIAVAVRHRPWRAVSARLRG